jgi:site-specific recombinase XerD
VFTTIESYQYDLHKFDAYLVKRLGNKFLPGDVSHDHIRDYLMWLSEVGHQKPNGPSARARALAAIRSFFKYAHRAGLLRDDPAADLPLPKIRIGEVRALSRDECGRLLRVVGANPSPFRKVRDIAMIVTFLLTGARLREIVRLDRGDIDLHESTIRLHRKGGEVNILPLAESAKMEDIFKAAEAQEPDKGVIHILPESKNFTWGGLVSGEEIFEESPNKNAWHGTTCIAPYFRDIAFKSGRKSTSHSESDEP